MKFYFPHNSAHEEKREEQEDTCRCGSIQSAGTWFGTGHFTGFAIACKFCTPNECLVQLKVNEIPNKIWILSVDCLFNSMCLSFLIYKGTDSSISYAFMMKFQLINWRGKNRNSN